MVLQFAHIPKCKKHCAMRADISHGIDNAVLSRQQHLAAFILVADHFAFFKIRNSRQTDKLPLLDAHWSFNPFAINSLA
jgi:hypothetical protein